MAGEVCIFRMTNTTDTEATITTDKIEFTEGAVPDNRAIVTSFEPEMSRTQTSNSAPFLDEARKPDTGYSGNRYLFELFFNEEGGAAGAIQKIRDWMKEENALKGKFPQGRFGIRNDQRPEFNLTPTRTTGYKIIYFKLTQDMLYPIYPTATLILEMSGDPVSLG